MSELKELLKQDTVNEDGLTLQEQNFLDILFDECGGDVRTAMDKSGMKGIPSSVMIKKFSKQIKDMAKEYLIASSAKAAHSLVSVLHDPNAIGVKNIIPAANSILDRAGVFKEEAVQVTEVRNMFILPPKDSPEDIKIIDHE